MQLRIYIDGSIVSFVVGKNNDNPLVLDTLKAVLKDNPTASPMIHTNRGSQYTSKEFNSQTAGAGLIRSMSRVGRCIDNAPMESFWGHFKDEAYKNQFFPTFESLNKAVSHYINYYNNERFQEKLNSLTPIEYRNKAIA